MRACLSIPVALFFLLFSTGPANANVTNDQVQSQHIREADGTSGQNTNSGAGVKTGHIQNSAVTSEKIQDGQVLNADLASGAVTDAKISGVISAVKLPVGTTTGTVAAGDHDHDNLYQKKHANVVVVAKSGGDFTDPIAAINSIIDASASNPYLLKIMPGVYDLGAGYLFMKEYVDIEGSGENATIVTSSYLFTVVASSISNSEIRLLTVKNTGYGAAILIDHASPRLSHLTALAQCSGPYQCVGIDLIASSSILSNVVANAAGSPTTVNYALRVWQNSSPTMNNINASALGGGVNFSIFVQDSSPTLSNVRSMASGGADNNFAFYLQRASPTLKDVTATATGSQSKGVYVSTLPSL